MKSSGNEFFKRPDGLGGIKPMKTLMPVVERVNVTESEQSAVLKATAMLTEVHDHIQETVPGSRERSIALTKIEEAHFAITAHLAS